jgi:hypothetical protein
MYYPMRQNKAKYLFYSLVDEGYYPIGTAENKYCKALMREVSKNHFKIGPARGDFEGSDNWYNHRKEGYDTKKCKEIFGDNKLTIDLYNILEEDLLGFKTFNI